MLKLGNLIELQDVDNLNIVLTLAYRQVLEPQLNDKDVEEVVQIKAEIDTVKTIIKLFNNNYRTDPIPNDILNQLCRGQVHSKQFSLAKYQEDDNSHQLYRKCISVPNHIPLKLQLIKDFHEVPAAGHPGRSKILELLAWHYDWPRMYKEVDQFIRTYHTC